MDTVKSIITSPLIPPVTPPTPSPVVPSLTEVQNVENATQQNPSLSPFAKLMRTAYDDQAKEDAHNRSFVEQEYMRMADLGNRFLDPKISWFDRLLTAFDGTVGTVFGMPQRAATRLLTNGEYDRPSEALKLSGLGGFAVDVFLDPLIALNAMQMARKAFVKAPLKEAVREITKEVSPSKVGILRFENTSVSAVPTKAYPMTIQELRDSAGIKPPMTFGEELFPEVFKPNLTRHYTTTVSPEIPNLFSQLNEAAQAGELSPKTTAVITKAFDELSLLRDKLLPKDSSVEASAAMLGHLTETLLKNPGQLWSLPQLSFPQVSKLQSFRQYLMRAAELIDPVPGRPIEQALVDIVKQMPKFGEDLPISTQMFNHVDNLPIFNSLQMPTSNYTVKIIQDMEKEFPLYSQVNKVRFEPTPITPVVPQYSSITLKNTGVDQQGNPKVYGPPDRQPTNPLQKGPVDSSIARAKFAHLYPSTPERPDVFEGIDLGPSPIKVPLKGKVTGLGPGAAFKAEFGSKIDPYTTIKPTQVEQVIDSVGPTKAASIINERLVIPNDATAPDAMEALQGIMSSPKGSWKTYIEESMQTINEQRMSKYGSTGPVPLKFLTSVTNPSRLTDAIGLATERLTSANAEVHSIVENLRLRLETSIRPIINDAESRVRIGEALNTGVLTTLSPVELEVAQKMKKAYATMGKHLGLPEEQLGKDYFPHLFDRLRVPGSLKWIDEDAPGSVQTMFHSLKERKGLEGFKLDSVDALTYYITGFAKKIAYEKAFKDMGPIFDSLGIDVNKLTGIIENPNTFKGMKALATLSGGEGGLTEADALLGIIRGVLGKPHPYDVRLGQWMASKGLRMAGITPTEEATAEAFRRQGPLWEQKNTLRLALSRWMIEQSGRRPATGISNLVKTGYYGNLLGAALDTTLQNLSQPLLNLVEFGKSYPKGIMAFTKNLVANPTETIDLVNKILDVSTPMFETALKHSMGLERLAPDKAKRIINDVVFGPMRIAEFINRGVTYFTALDSALASGLTREQALHQAYRGVIKTQFGYSPLELGPAYRHPVTSALLQFTTFPVKYTQLLADWVTGGVKDFAKAATDRGIPVAISDALSGKLPETAKLLRLAGLVGATILSGQALGVDFLNYSLTSFPNRLGPVMDLYKPAQELVQGTLQATVRGEPEEANRSFRNFWESLPQAGASFVPWRYPKKIYDLVEAVKQGGIVDNKTGHIKYNVTPMEALILATGLTPVGVKEQREFSALEQNYRAKAAEYKNTILTFYKEGLFEEAAAKQVELQEKLKEQFYSRFKTALDAKGVNVDSLGDAFYIHITPQDVMNAMQETNILQRQTKGFRKSLQQPIKEAFPAAKKS